MRNRTLLSLFSVFWLFNSSVFANDSAEATAQHTKPKVIIFDVNETLLDLENMRTSVGEALNGRDDLLPLWFSTMLHHSLVVSATGEYQSFGNIGVAALEMVA